MSQATSLAVLIMAAGQSRRMGRDKLLLRGRDGAPLLADRIDTALATGRPVFVALPDQDTDRLKIVRATKATPLFCPNASLGMGHSLSDAIGMLPLDLDGVLIMLADMPALTTRDINQVCAAFGPDCILRGGTQNLTPGHPVLVPARFLSKLDVLQGDQGAQNTLKDVPTRIVPLPDDHAAFDIDTGEDWQLWLTRTAQP